MEYLLDTRDIDRDIDGQVIGLQKQSVIRGGDLLNHLANQDDDIHPFAIIERKHPAMDAWHIQYLLNKLPHTARLMNDAVERGLFLIEVAFAGDSLLAGLALPPKFALQELCVTLNRRKGIAQF